MSENYYYYNLKKIIGAIVHLFAKSGIFLWVVTCGTDNGLYIDIVMRTYLHISNEQCKQKQPKGGNEDDENNFSHICACTKILSHRTAQIDER